MVARRVIARHSARVEPNAGPTRAPRILLAEDDDASAQFLSHALTSLGWHVTVCGNGTAALQCARAERFDLLLFDRNLPGPGAMALLGLLRDDPDAASRHTSAIASSAEWSATLRREAEAAGYAAILDKPISHKRLAEVVRQACENSLEAPLRDDHAALAATGNADNLAALRRLFRVELERWTAERLDATAMSDPELPDRLHRLCASAGFCGAPALAGASRALLWDLRQGSVTDAARQRFSRTLAATREHFDTE